MPPALPFIDLAAQRARLAGRIEAAIAAVLAHGRFVHGPEVRAFEAALGAFTGAAHVVACASGTAALSLVLRALGTGPGDAVLVPAFTFAATAGAVAWLGAAPVLTDVLEATLDMDPASLEQGIAAARAQGLRPVGVMAVDLFGQPADYPALGAIAAAHGLWLAADAAQSLGGSLDGRRVGTLAVATAASFHPSKPLGGYGDGGAVLTDDAALAARIRSLADHGQGAGRYRHDAIGTNSRLDTLQAAILLAKLAVFDDELARRDAVAACYDAALAGRVGLPRLRPGARSSWAQYTIRTPRRDHLRARLRAAGIPTAIHYPLPLHHQPAYRPFPRAAPTLPVSERLAREVLSLPLHAYLDPADQARVIEAVLAATS